MRMKAIKTHFFILIYCLFAQTTLVQDHAKAELVDKVIAVVNDDIITLSELEAETETLYQRLALEKSGEALQEALLNARAATLDAMIDERLISQQAKKTNITVSDEEIEAAYTATRQRAQLSEREFRSKLAESGLTPELYRNRLASSLLQRKLFNITVGSKIVITDEMILDYYDEHYTSRVKGGDKYYLLQMGFTITEDKDAAWAKAKKVHARAVAGGDFRSLAKEFSELPSAADGGDIGIFSLDEMAVFMRDAVADLSPGSISSIVETPAGFQFFKLLSGSDGDYVVTTPYEEVEGEIRDQLYELKMREALQQWVTDLKDNAYIQKL